MLTAITLLSITITIILFTTRRSADSEAPEAPYISAYFMSLLIIITLLTCGAFWSDTNEKVVRKGSIIKQLTLKPKARGFIMDAYIEIDRHNLRKKLIHADREVIRSRQDRFFWLLF